MSVLEIEKAVVELPLGERQYLAAWLVESLEDEADEIAARRALEEGGKTIPWEQLKKELSLENAIYLLRMNFRKFMRWSFFLWQGDRVQRYAYITPVRATQLEEKETSRNS